MRPIRAEDEPALRRFFDRLSDDTIYLRFQNHMRKVSDELVDFFSHVDQRRHVAFVCVSGEEIVGDARYVANADGRSCEFAVVVGDAWHHTGIAALLMEALTSAARQRGIRSMEGLVLRDNADMLHFVHALGFEHFQDPHGPGLLRVVKRLQPA